MIAFSAVCGALVVSVLFFMVRPLRVASTSVQSAPNDAIVAVYRRQLAELEADRRRGLVDADQFLTERDDLEQRVIADLAKGSQSNGKTRPPVRLGGLKYVIAVGVPLAAALLYLAIGSQEGVCLKDVAEV